MNFKGLEEADYQYDTTCLGGFTKGTTVVEMAAAYATLCNDGEYRNPTCIVSITDTEGKILVSNNQESNRIYFSSAARMMTEVLESCVTVKSATASGCKLSVDMPAACKTGTTTDYVDGWLCGYTPYYTTAVWVGMDVYKSVDDLKGNTYPAYIWKNYMDKIHQGLSRRDFDEELEEDDEDETEKTTKATTEDTEEEDNSDNDKSDDEDTPSREGEYNYDYDDDDDDKSDNEDNSSQSQDDTDSQTDTEDETNDDQEDNGSEEEGQTEKENEQEGSDPLIE
jgi:membrane peptidoglycan carboxypeptidase